MTRAAGHSVLLLCLAGLAGGKTPQTTTGVWAPLANMTAPRTGACAARLLDGRVLISGGTAAAGTLDTTEIFGSGGLFSSAAQMSAARSKHSCTTLPDGRVLVAGGSNDSGPITLAELYDPATNRWLPAGEMAYARSAHSATPLRDGRVLIAGGQGAGAVTSTLEIYDPNANAFRFVSTGVLSSPRTDHAAVLMPGGQVLLAGGTDGSNALASSDVFDPATGSVSRGAALLFPRAGASATLLGDDTVLVAGGTNGVEDLATAEIFDSAAGKFSQAPRMATARRGHLAFLLPRNNQVLLVGGDPAGNSTELFTPWLRAFRSTGSLDESRADAVGAPTASDGVLLLAGGKRSSLVLESSAVYRFATLKTDREQYEAGTRATISGSGWQPGERVSLLVQQSPRTRDDRTVTATADAAGEFAAAYDVQDTGRTFTVTAASAASDAQIRFASNPAANLDQCANGPLSAPSVCTWVNGNVNGSKAHYSEGDSVGYRLVMTSIPTSGSNAVTIEWDTTQSGKHALDYITNWDRSVTGNLCQGVTGCSTAFTPYPIPPDPHLGSVPQIGGNFAISGGSITGVSAYTLSGTYAGSSSTSITITFTASSPTVVLAWGGHIATRMDWGVGNSAVAISGSPFHTRLLSLNGSGGNQDRSLSNDAVTFPGSITITKAATIAGSATSVQPFSFTASPTPLADFSVCGGADCTHTFSNITNFTTYTVAETSVSGWSFSGVSCTVSGGLSTSPPASTTSSLQISLKEGDNVNCTFSNQAQNVTLTVIKHVVNNNGGTATAADFTMSVPAGTPSSFPGSETGTAVSLPPNTAYSVGENGPGGYSATYSSGCSGTLTVGQPATCTLTNTDQAAQLTLTKVVVNNHGGTAKAADWTLTADGPTKISGAGGASGSVKAGTYTLSESGPAGYAAGAWNCSGGSLSGNQVTLALGQSASCTITNTDQSAHLSISKTVQNTHGGTAVATDWTVTATAGSTTLSGAGSAAGDVPAGVYTLSESAGPSGYTAGNWSCTGGTLNGSQLTLAVGQTATCAITNSDQSAHLTLSKIVTNAHGGTAVADNWTLSAAGPTPISGAGGASGNVNAGTYTLSESTGPAGYTASAWSCSGATVAAGNQVTLGVGQSATCSITNSDQTAHLKLVKVVNNSHGGTAVATAWTLSASGPTPLSGAGGVESDVNAGTYTLAESAGPAGYTAGTWSCVGGTSSGNQVTLALGQSVTCSITNSDQTAHLKLVKNVSNTHGGTAVATDWTLSASGPSPISGAGGAESDVNAGTYVLSESTGPAGYTAGTWTCSAGTLAGSQLTLVLGQSATCSITNSDVGATLTVVKYCLPNTDLTSPFTVHVQRPTGSGASGTAVCNSNSGTGPMPLSAGTYTVSEVPPANSGWNSTARFAGACSATGQVSLTLGQNATCFILNTNDACIVTPFNSLSMTQQGLPVSPVMVPARVVRRQ